jgi:hypothetical protein
MAIRNEGDSCPDASGPEVDEAVELEIKQFTERLPLPRKIRMSLLHGIDQANDRCHEERVWRHELSWDRRDQHVRRLRRLIGDPVLATRKMTPSHRLAITDHGHTRQRSDAHATHHPNHCVESTTGHEPDSQCEPSGMITMR